jgi:hypothetical protein
VKPNKPHDPVHIGALGMNGVMVEAEDLADFVEQVLVVDFSWGPAYEPLLRRRENRYSQFYCLKTRLISTYQGKLA